jgi:tetratricopeptide (TPR) repeat protein
MPGEQSDTENVFPRDSLDEDIAQDTAFLERVEDLYARLDSLDFYAILKVDHRASKDDVKKAYYRVAREFHPDRHLSSTSDTLKKKLNSIFSYLTQAYRVLSHEDSKREYDSDATHAAHEKKDSMSLAQQRFQEGSDAYEQGQYSDAAELFSQAIYIDNSVPDYYFSLGLSLKKLDKLNEAAKALHNASGLDPSNPDYLAELGHVFLRLGFILRAKAAFEKAIVINPVHVRALEGLVQAKKQT